MVSRIRPAVATLFTAYEMPESLGGKPVIDVEME